MFPMFTLSFRHWQMSPQTCPVLQKTFWMCFNEPPSQRCVSRWWCSGVLWDVQQRKQGLGCSHCWSCFYSITYNVENRLECDMAADRSESSFDSDGEIGFISARGRRALHSPRTQIHISVASDIGSVGFLSLVHQRLRYCFSCLQKLCLDFWRHFGVWDLLCLRFVLWCVTPDQDQDKLCLIWEICVGQQGYTFGHIQ